MMYVHLSCNMERLSKNTFDEICSSYEWGVKIIRAPWTKFHLCECGGGAAPYEFGLNLKYTHETGISTWL